MPFRVSKQQARQYGIVPAKAATSRQRYGGYRSHWEWEYAAYLDQDGTVRSWQYEAIRLILAPKTTYLPDFMVVTVRGKLEIHEVKGFARPAGMVKLKVAARLFTMFQFYLVRKVNGLWDLTPVQR